MTKENIFPLYVGKCKVRHTKIYHGDEMFGDSEASCDYEFQAFYPNNDKFNEKVVAGYKGQTATINLDDCTLILKPLSKMSEEHKIEYGLISSEWHESQVTRQFAELFWLIQNGYAISDELFEKGIATE